MRQVVTRALLLLLAILAGAQAQGQRGRDVEGRSYEENARKAEEYLKADRTADHWSDVWKRQGRYETARENWRLRPTKENFQRIQAAAAILNETEGPDPGHGKEEPIAVPNPLDGTKSLHYGFLTKALIDHHSQGASAEAGITVLDFLPNDPGSFQKVFGRAWTAADQAKLRRAKELLREQKPAFHSSLFGALNATDSSVIVLVGHNKLGSLTSLDGSTMELHKIGELCAQASKLCIFAVCDSQAALGPTAIGTTGKLGFVSSAKLTRDLIQISRRYRRNSSDFAPIDMTYDMIERVDVNGNLVRYWGYQTRHWFEIHLIVIVVPCTVDDLC